MGRRVVGNHPLAGLALACAALLPASTQAATDDGVSFLQASINTDGSYGVLPERDTDLAIRALNAYDAAVDEDGATSAWLAYADAEELDLWMRIQRGRADLGTSLTAEIAELAALQNKDGGFSYYKDGGPSTTQETAVALQLLARAGYTDLTKVSSAIGFLIGRQQSDGGFAFEDNTSTITVTVEAIEALSAWRSVFNVSTYIDKAVAWLYQTQNSDGSFGTDPHPVLSTAMALAATADEASASGSAWTAGYDYLVAAQQTGGSSSCAGSWDCDPYTTSWALLALNGVLPDLTVTAITWSPTSLLEGDATTVTITVKNGGRAAAASGATVSLTLQNPADGSSATIGQTTLSGLAAGASQSVSVPWDTAGVNGARYLVAEADTLKKVKETDETNNTLTAAVTITPKVDLSLTSADLAYTPEDPGTTETITIEAKVHNSGGTPAKGVKAVFTLDPGSSATVLATHTFDLDPGAVKTISAQTQLSLGSHVVKVDVDPDNAIDEGLEDNNSASITIEMKPRIDLVLTSSQVQASPTSLIEADPVNVVATIYNQREDVAKNVRVRLSMYDPKTMTSLDQRKPIAPDYIISSIPGNTSAVAYITGSTAGYSGSLYVVVDADADDEIEETHEDNNRGQASISVTAQGNLNVTTSDFTAPTSLTEGTTGTLKATVRNNGGATISNIVVAFTGTGPGGAFTIGTTTISSLAGGASTTTSNVNWDTTGFTSGSYTLTVSVDPANVIAEKSESDNTVSKACTLNPRADLSIVTGDITSSPALPEEGDKTTVNALVKNLTATSASTAFLVRFYVGDPNSGGTLLGEVSKSSLSGNTSFTASVLWDTTNYGGSQPIYVQVDPTGTISELVESNNVATRTINVTKAYRPDFAIADTDLSQSPESGVTPGSTVQIKAVVHNNRNYTATAAVRLYLGDPASGGTAVGSDQSVSVPALGQASVTFNWATPSSTTTSTKLYVVVDPDNVVGEPDETNNKASIQYKGRTGADTTPLNLQASVDYHTVTLTWSAPTNAANTIGYRVYRDGKLLSPTTDLTSTATASADSQVNTTNVPASAIDSSTSTYWQSASHAAPWWLQLDLPAAKLLNRMDISWHGSYRGKDYQIQGWNGSSWVTLHTVTGNTTNSVSHALTTWMVTSRVRIYVTAGQSSSYLAIYDTHLFGFEPYTARLAVDPDLLSGTYKYVVTGVDKAGYESPDSSPATVTIDPPAAVSNLQALPDFTKVDLRWDASTEKIMRSYLVYRDGALLNAEAKVSGGTATADSQNSTSYTPDKALDGSTSTYWLSSSHATPWWWQVAYSSAQLVSSITLTWHSSYRGTDYEIQAWDGDAWVTLTSVTGNTSNTVTHTWKLPYPTDKVRVYVTASSSTSYAGLYEAAVYAVGAVTAPEFADTYLLSGPYTYEVSVLNYLGEQSAKSSVKPSVPPPLPPTGLTVNTSENAASLSWPAVTNNASMVSYLVYRDGSLLLPVSERRGNGTATADSQNSTSNIPSYAVDSSTTTYWLSSSHSAPWYWQIDFSSLQVVSKVTALWHSSYRGKDYQIQFWDGKYWRPAATITGNTIDNVATTFSHPVGTTKLRIYITGSSSSSYAGLYDVKIEGLAPYTTTSYSDSPVPGGDRKYGVTVLNTVGEESVPRESSSNVFVPPPSGLTASVSGDNVTLGWSGSSSASLAGYYLYRDGKLLNAPGTTNLSSGGTATASSTNSTSYEAADAIDGSTSTYWLGAASQTSWTWDLAFPKARTLSGVELVWQGSYYGIDYVVQTKVAGAWVTQQTVAGNSLTTRTHAFPVAVSAEGVRIFITKSTSSYPGLYEVRSLAPAAITGLGYVDYNVQSGSRLYEVRAADTYGGESAGSQATAVVGSIAPPSGLTAVGSQNKVNLAWTASPTTGILGYLVYRDDVRVTPDADIAAAATATASSQSSSTYSAGKANDGSTSTYWQSASATNGAATFELTWGTARKPDSVTLAWHSSYRGTDYDIESWDGTKWVTELKVVGNTLNTVTHSLPSFLATTKMRVSIARSTSTYSAIYEINVKEPQWVTGTSSSDTVIDNRDYGYTVVAVGSTHVSQPSNRATVTILETTPPAMPTGFGLSSYTASNIVLKWNANTEADLYAYQLFYEASTTPLTTTTALSYTHSSVIKSTTTTYTYRLVALDRNGNVSSESTYTFAPAPPTAPMSLTAAVAGPDVVLSWTVVTDPLRTSILVYRDGAVVNSAVAGTATTYTDTSVARGTHTYEVSGKDAFGREGPKSNSATVEVNGTDLSLSAEDLFFLPEKPSEFDNVTLSAVVNNNGDEATGAIEVDFYDGDPTKGGTLIGTGVAPALDGGELGLAQVIWDLTGEAGSHTIYAIVDPDNTVVEYYEDNNQASKVLNVTAVPTLEVAIRDVDATAFPKIVSYISVNDSTGQSVTDLTTRNLVMKEDGVTQTIDKLTLQSSGTSTEPMVDLVSLIDTSGSMGEELALLPEIMQDVYTQMILRGINARQVNYSLAADAGEVYEVLTKGVFNGVLYSPIQSEDWGPATTWAAQYFDWRPGAVRIIVPVSDENCYQGSGEDANDLKSLQEAITASVTAKASVFPLWGDGADTSVINEAKELGTDTGGEAFYYEEAEKIVEAISLAILTKVATYTAEYTTTNPARDGTTRAMTLDATYRNATGQGTGSYVAPSDNIVDFAALKLEIIPGNPLAGDTATLKGTVANYGSIAADAVIQLYQGGTSGQALGAPIVMTALEPAEVRTFTTAWLALPGSNELVMVVDPQNTVSEKDENNNQAKAKIVIPGLQGAELAVSAAEFTASPAAPLEGDKVTLSATVYNLGTETKNVLVQFYDGDPATGGKQIGTDTVIPTFPANSSQKLTVTWNSSAQDGDNTLYVWVDPLNAIQEIQEDNNRAALDLKVTPKPVQIRLVTDKSEYGANEDVALSGTIENRQLVSFTGTVALSIVDADGGVVADLGTVAPSSLGAATYPDWAYYVPVTVKAGGLHRPGAYAAYAADFAALLTQVGATGSFDPASLRVAEFDASGNRLGYWSPKLFPAPGYDAKTSPKGTVLWPAYPSSISSGDRYFRIYFDTIERGPKPTEASPVIDGSTLAVGTEQGEILAAARGADGRYAAFKQIDDLNAKVRVGVADLNGDGLQDVLALDGNREVYLYARKSDGTFAAKATLVTQTSTATPTDVIAGDFNEDGALDLLVTEQTTKPVLYLNDGKGVFTPGTPLTALTVNIYATEVVDVNMDGHLDIVAAVQNGAVHHYLGDGKGLFATPALACTTVASTPYGLAVADFDGDTFVDLLVHQGSGGKTYFCGGTSTGLSYFTPVEVTSLKTTSYASLDDVDYNADGKRDVLVTTYTTRTVVVYPGNGNATFGTAVSLGALPGDGLSAAASGGIELTGAGSAPKANPIPTATFTASWNTGTTVAGPYAALGILLEDGDERSRSQADFTIGAAEKLKAAVATDRSSYAINELVEITATLSNETANLALSGLSGTVSVVDPAGKTVYSETFTRDALEIGATATWTAWWNVGTSSPGTYTAKLEGTTSNGVTASASSSFVVESTEGTGLGLVGGLVADPTDGSPGQPISLTWEVTNKGNAALKDLPLRIQVTDAGATTVFETHDLGEYDLSIGEIETDVVLQETDSLALGDYGAVLQAQIGGTWTSIAHAFFGLVDIIGTLVVDPEIAEGGVDTLAIDYTVLSEADDDLKKVTLRVDLIDSDGNVVASFSEPESTLDVGETWSGSFSQATASLTIGDYTAVLTLVIDGDPLELATAPFSIVDTIAPSSKLAFLGTEIEQDGTHYIPSATLLELTATDNFSGVAAILWSDNGGAQTAYSAAFGLAEGTHAFAWQAQDVAKNLEPLQSAAVVVDDSPPEIALGGAEEDACAVDSVTLTATVTDLSPVTTTEELDGKPYDGSAVTKAGKHTYEVTSVDLLGHSATARLSFTIETGDCACQTGDVVVDQDGDGQKPCEGDCNDADPRIYAGALEALDGLDNDCDGLVDEGECPKDADRDGFATSGGDCDDSDPKRNPAAIEVEDGVDNNCNGTTDEEDAAPRDEDGDGFPREKEGPDPGDCNDNDASTYPYGVEVDTDGKDNDCDGFVDEGRIDCDADYDGYTEQDGDCTDEDTSVNPGAEDVCDGEDRNCDGAAEDDCETPTPPPGDDDDTEPGDDDTQPGDDDTEPGDDDTEPGDDDTEPGDDDTGPGDDDTEPGDDDTTAPGDDDDTITDTGDDDSSLGGDVDGDSEGTDGCGCSQHPETHRGPGAGLAALAALAILRRRRRSSPR